jgi:two-component system OmpR family sensor kinase
MSPEFIPLAFDRFAREDESRGGSRPGSRGAGLGLSIVHALVTSAGGTVTMTNRRPRGLSVVVTIPVSTESAAEAPGTAAVPESISVPESAASPAFKPSPGATAPPGPASAAGAAAIPLRSEHPPAPSQDDTA